MFSGDFMRPEVWHALSVHFPIALLSFATITMLISFFIKEMSRRHWQIAAGLLLFAGCLTAWISIYSGNVADGFVARKICDPTILKDHEIAGQTMTWLFTAATLFYIVFFTKAINEQLRKFSIYIAFLLMLTGTGYLVYTGHLGASLVYEQGAGVKNHSVDCEEYE
ncbi:MAG: DUF2231 domain-containing protein [Cyclobacteriaceae bacterium]